MTWLRRLWQTYDKLVLNTNDGEDKPLPIAHVSQWSHINIVIDSEGNFKRAAVDKRRIILPATEASSNRTGGVAPHVLADQLQYVAKDYPVYVSTSKKVRLGFDDYQKQLKDWCDSAFCHPKAVAVYKYVSKGQVVADLIANSVLFIDTNNKYIEKWENKDNVPPIYSVLTKKAGEVDIRTALVAWTVESPNEIITNTWEDPSLIASWTNYVLSQSGQQSLCLVSGKYCDIALMHPKNIRFPGDGAKLISSNDTSGYTFRGMFTNAEQAATIGAEITQKAHNALSWLIANRGVRNEDQFTVVWALSGKEVINPFAEIDFEADIKDIGIDHGQDFGQSAFLQIKHLLLGYKASLSDTDQLSLMCVDAATPGRAAMTYYKEFSPDDYFNKLLAWQEDLVWVQRCVIKEKNAKGKEVNKTVYKLMAPSIYHIAQAVYGSFLSTSLKKNIYARLLPCIVEQRSIPLDVVRSAIRQACNPHGCENWEWERNVGIACSLYKGFMVRHPEVTKRRYYSMSVDEVCISRDYLYGRLLAVAEKLEDVALKISGENRQTTAVRYFQQFAQRPFTTWRNIELALIPYKNKLKGKRDGFLINKEKELDEIMNKFSREEFISDNALSGEFLLGYHSQKMAYRQVQEEPVES